MRSLKVKVIGTGVLGSLLVGAIWYSVSRPGSQEVAPVNHEVGVQSPASAPSEKAEKAIAAATMVTSPSVIEKVADSTVFKEYAHKEDLTRFSAIAQKALPSSADQAARNDLLKDEELINSLKPLLTTAAQNLSEQQLQNSALDMLFAALNSDSRDIAVGVLKEVVASSGVESDAVPQNERQQLAGIKAEVLMALSAHPKFQEDLTAIFPGPVTGKIWQNVQERQKSNLAESALRR